MSDGVAAGAGGGTAAPKIILGGRYEIFADQPKPAFDSPGAPAYHAVDRKGRVRALIAMICRSDHCPRIDTIPILRRLPRLPVMVPIEVGVVDWPPTGGRRAVVLFEPPNGKRIVDDPDAEFPRWRENQITDWLIGPLLPALMEFEKTFLQHRAIRLDNLFHADATGGDVVLGECVTCQPGFNQPIIYESTETGLADPAGRGEASPTEDLYALGVLITVLLTGGNPVAGMSDEDILISKLSVGSYATLSRNLRVSLPMVEVLRGLLCDDPNERWTAEDMEVWLNGRHLSPKQPILPRKAARAFELAGRQYINAPAAACGLALNWEAGVAAVESGAVLRWVQRSLQGDGVIDAVSEAMGTSNQEGDSREQDSHKLARVILALNPQGPICFKSFRATIDGISNAYAVHYDKPEMRDCYREIIIGRLPNIWYAVQSETRPEFTAYRRGFEVARRFFGRGSPEFAAVRCLYTSNLGWPCQSPLLAANYVSSAEEIIPAVESMRGQAELPIDDHIIAFAAANSQGLSDRTIMGLMSDEDPAEFALNLLEFFADIQRVSGPTESPLLSAWLAETMDPVIARYHSHALRTQLSERVRAASATGALSQILTIVDDRDLQSEDHKNFREAQKHYFQIARYVHWIRQGGMFNRSFTRAISRPIAAVTSACLAGLGLLVMSMFYIT